MNKVKYILRIVDNMIKNYLDDLKVTHIRDQKHIHLNTLIIGRLK